MTIQPRTGLSWQIATVESVIDLSQRVKLFRLKLPVQKRFLAGQHYDIRLTAPDGYQAQRSYSISSSPDDLTTLEFAIELIHDGEVSSYFHEVVQPGEKIELRGPIGGHFTRKADSTDPTLFIAGGSGIAPIMSMLRQQVGRDNAARLLMFSVRTEQDILFKDELEKMANEDPTFDLVVILTRDNPAGWHGQTRRIDQAMINSAIESFEGPPVSAFICGGTEFVGVQCGRILGIERID